MPGRILTGKRLKDRRLTLDPKNPRYRRNLMAKNMSRLNPSCHLMISGSVVNRSHVAPRLTSLFPLSIRAAGGSEVRALHDGPE